MMSKYIPKKGSTIKRIPLSDMEWWSIPPKSMEKQEYVNPLASEKKRIESIPLEEVSFKDIYKFPLHSAKYGSWVYDKNSNFVFEFEFDHKDSRNEILSILNGDAEPTKIRQIRHNEGMIQLFKDDKWVDIILIRGWGNLTGVGSYNLNGEHAAKIQDTFAEFIIEKLAGTK